MADYVVIEPETLYNMLSDAQMYYPSEAVGLLLGHGNHVVAYQPMANIAQDTMHHFEIDRKAFEIQVAQARKQSLQIIGFYHSHPGAKPIPSREDIIGALPYGRHMIHIITSLNQRRTQTTAWRYADIGDVTALQIIQAMQHAPVPVLQNTSQRVGLIIGTTIALILLLFIALTLLPPAPSIP
jgi:proteasome lid subunit RPN8/RPN11